MPHKSAPSPASNPVDVALSDGDVSPRSARPALAIKMPANPLLSLARLLGREAAQEVMREAERTGISTGAEAAP